MSARRISQVIPIEVVERLIFVTRGQKVMLDSDLARLYAVETGALNRAVKRNASRFPSDFMFQLTKAEAKNLRCQFGISNPGGRRYLPYVFSEHGVAMLADPPGPKRLIGFNRDHEKP